LLQPWVPITVTESTPKEFANAFGVLRHQARAVKLRRENGHKEAQKAQIGAADFELSGPLCGKKIQLTRFLHSRFSNCSKCPVAAVEGARSFVVVDDANRGSDGTAEVSVRDVT
jgi:hypothetical protein